MGLFPTIGATYSCSDSLEFNRRRYGLLNGYPTCLIPRSVDCGCPSSLLVVKAERQPHRLEVLLDETVPMEACKHQYIILRILTFHTRETGGFTLLSSPTNI
jgi:hypothetical protein